jgi:hypothetical protein
MLLVCTYVRRGSRLTNDLREIIPLYVSSNFTQAHSLWFTCLQVYRLCLFSIVNRLWVGHQRNRCSIPGAEDKCINSPKS